MLRVIDDLTDYLLAYGGLSVPTHTPLGQAILLRKRTRLDETEADDEPEAGAPPQGPVSIDD